MTTGRRNNQAGFAVIETLLVIVILSVIGFTVWYVLHNSRTTTQIYNKTGKSTVVPAQRAPALAVTTTYSKAPADLQAAIHAFAVKKYPACLPSESAGPTSTGPFKSYINQPVDPVVRYVANRSALVNPLCNSGAQALYTYTNGAWQFAVQSIDGFSCTTLQKYRIPAAILTRPATCWTDHSKQVPYTQR